MTIDHGALRVKYREERDKWLRPDGNDQYIEPTGRFASMLDDPYTERVEREQRFDDVTVALIGGGFAGLCVGALGSSRRASTMCRSSRSAATSAARGTGTATPAQCATPRP